MKVRVDSTRCQGHALCAQKASEAFDLDDVGYSVSRFDDVVPAELEPAIKLAASGCPEHAIVIENG